MRIYLHTYIILCYAPMPDNQPYYILQELNCLLYAHYYAHYAHLVHDQN